MSRIGKKPVQIPAGVTVAINGSEIEVKGSKGSLFYSLPSGISAEVVENDVIIARSSDLKSVRALHGLSRALINNMVIGVTKGFEKRLEIVGVGYRAQATGKSINLTLGFSHPVEMQAPEGVNVEMAKDAKNVIIVTGIDRQQVGEFAANIRKLRKPEPYKGKGIRYVGEYVRRKAGKSAAKK